MEKLIAGQTSCETVFGRIVEIDLQGKVWIDFVGNENGPLQAMSTFQIPMDAVADWTGRRVLLAFDPENGQPVIMGTLYSQFVDTAEPQTLSSVAPSPPAVVPQRVRVVAEEQMSFECGRSSLTMRKDGKIVIKGEQIVSRATGTNRIKGGSVSIN